jgi:hypothetical protein
MSERIPKPLKWAAVAGLAALALTSCRPNSSEHTSSPSPASPNAYLINAGGLLVKSSNDGECLFGIWDTPAILPSGKVKAVATARTTGNECPNGALVPTGEFPHGYIQNLRGLIDDWNQLILSTAADLKHPTKKTRVKATEQVTTMGVYSDLNIAAINNCTVSPSTTLQEFGDVTYEGKHLEVSEVLNGGSGSTCAPTSVVLTVDTNYGMINV